MQDPKTQTTPFRERFNKLLAYAFVGGIGVLFLCFVGGIYYLDHIRFCK